MVLPVGRVSHFEGKLWKAFPCSCRRKSVKMIFFIAHSIFSHAVYKFYSNVGPFFCWSVVKRGRVWSASGMVSNIRAGLPGCL